MTAGRPGSIPLWTGALCRIRTGAGFVKNLSKYVQESFTIKGVGYDILSLSEGKNTFPPANSFYTLFSFFHLFFLSPFLFTLFFILHGLRPVSQAGNRALPCVQPSVVSNATNLSQAIQNLFTHIGRRRGILNTSAREAAIPQLASQPIFYFSFTPLFQICVVNRQSAAVPFPPTGSGALLVLRRNPIPYGQKTARMPRFFCAFRGAMRKRRHARRPRGKGRFLKI